MPGPRLGSLYLSVSATLSNEPLTVAQGGPRGSGAAAWWRGRHNEDESGVSDAGNLLGYLDHRGERRATRLGPKRAVHQPRPTVFSTIQDGEYDGYISWLDCNDDNALIHPCALEILDGIDDDRGGAVDDGFIRSLTTPLSTIRRLWPDDKARLPDAGWTGGHLGVVYKDLSIDQPSVRLMVRDPTSGQRIDTLLGNGCQPRIARRQDRFGAVWVGSSWLDDCVVFAPFDRQGLPIGPIEPIELFGRNPAMSWSGTGIDSSPIEGADYTGSFGIAYDADRDFAATGDVLLRSRSLEPFQRAGTVRIDRHANPASKLAGMPSVAGNTSGFAVSRHVERDTFDRLCSRVSSWDKLEPVQEFMPDADAARSSRILWTGGEHVMVTDNLIKDTTDVHLRRLDLSGNSHQAAEWGPWAEVNVSRAIGTANSVHPDVANTGRGFGVIWIEQAGSNSYGRLYFASVVHN